MALPVLLAFGPVGRTAARSLGVAGLTRRCAYALWPAHGGVSAAQWPALTPKVALASSLARALDASGMTRIVR